MGWTVTTSVTSNLCTVHLYAAESQLIMNTTPARIKLPKPVAAAESSVSPAGYLLFCSMHMAPPDCPALLVLSLAGHLLLFLPSSSAMSLVWQRQPGSRVRTIAAQWY